MPALMRTKLVKGKVLERMVPASRLRAKARIHLLKTNISKLKFQLEAAGKEQFRGTKASITRTRQGDLGANEARVYAAEMLARRIQLQHRIKRLERNKRSLEYRLKK